MTEYPKSFPLASVSSYGAAIAMGVIRTPFEAGNARQRRIHAALPHMFRLSFIMDQATLWSWMPWVNEHAYGWFLLDLVSYFADGEKNVPHAVRFATDIQSELINMRGSVRYWRVSVEAEWLPSVQGAPIVVGGWVIAKTPAAPAVDWVLAGTPASHSGYWIIGGKAGRPSAVS